MIMSTRRQMQAAPGDAGSDPTQFAFSRTLDAPRELVWKAWSQAESLARWWGPKEAKIRVIKLEFRPGGMFHYAMQFQPGRDMFGRFIYREIAPPGRLVFVNSFADADGGITRAPFPQLQDKWPLEILNTLTLREAGAKTELTLRAGPIDATEEEREMFAAMRDSMRQGYGGTFDKLADVLAGIR